jgi:hypothetical protein
VSAATFLFAGDADGFATPADVRLLESRMKGSASEVEAFLVPKKDWSHLDFILSMDAAELVYKPIMEIMERASKP